MRQAFVQALTEIAATDERVILLTADLGFMVLEQFAQRYPTRFYNVGVAEANMVSMAVGLAEAGFIPFLYSIATFASMRPYEQFRDGAILHQLPVRLVGIGGGFEYGHSGITHYAVEDLAIMRAQPELYTIAPADPQQTTTAIRDMYALPNPIYYRIGKNDKATIPELAGRFRVGGVERIGSGGDLLILSTGAITADAVAAMKTLAGMGIDCTVGVVASLRPEPTEELRALLETFPAVLTVEAHYVTGGLGSLTAEVIAEHGIACRLKRCGIQRMPYGASGSESYMNHTYQISQTDIVNYARELTSVHKPINVQSGVHLRSD